MPSRRRGRHPSTSHIFRIHRETHTRHFYTSTETPSRQNIRHNCRRYARKNNSRLWTLVAVVLLLLILKVNIIEGSRKTINRTEIDLFARFHLQRLPKPSHVTYTSKTALFTKETRVSKHLRRLKLWELLSTPSHGEESNISPLSVIVSLQPYNLSRPYYLFSVQDAKKRMQLGVKVSPDRVSLTYKGHRRSYSFSANAAGNATADSSTNNFTTFAFLFENGVITLHRNCGVARERRQIPGFRMKDILSETNHAKTKIVLGRRRHKNTAFEGQLCQFTLHRGADAARNYCRFLRRRCRESQMPRRSKLPRKTNASGRSISGEPDANISLRNKDNSANSRNINEDVRWNYRSDPESSSSGDGKYSRTVIPSNSHIAFSSTSAYFNPQGFTSRKLYTRTFNVASLRSRRADVTSAYARGRSSVIRFPREPKKSDTVSDVSSSNVELSRVSSDVLPSTKTADAETIKTPTKSSDLFNDPLLFITDFRTVQTNEKKALAESSTESASSAISPNSASTTTQLSPRKSPLVPEPKTFESTTATLSANDQFEDEATTVAKPTISISSLSSEVSSIFQKSSEDTTTANYDPLSLVQTKAENNDTGFSATTQSVDPLLAVPKLRSVNSNDATLPGIEHASGESTYPTTTGEDVANLAASGDEFLEDTTVPLTATEQPATHEPITFTTPQSQGIDQSSTETSASNSSRNVTDEVEITIGQTTYTIPSWASTLLLCKNDTTAGNKMYLCGLIGPKGEPGPKGPPGPPGRPGRRGPEGRMGMYGPYGMPGLPGDSGPKGEKGHFGGYGRRGPKGEQGQKGDTGMIGPPGIVGMPGSDGMQGIAGQPGFPGAPGRPGDQGPPGLPGRQGEPGPNGMVGKPGAEGDVGLDGPPGPPGLPGDYGEIGTMGSPGVKGMTGAAGDAGETGMPGGDGEPGPPGKVGRMGLQGKRGEIGLHGPRGAPGPSDLKGFSGSQGPAGLKGDKGSRGPRGPRGDRGKKGEKGDVGLRGAPGRSGRNGLNGTDGDPGPIGPPGPPGEKGLLGHKGKRGPTGSEGGQGPPGQFGETGLHGSRGVAGEPGDIGIPGRTGSKGKKGKEGKPGKPGQTGTEGYPGETGRRGRMGSKGPQGVPGARGEAGFEGPMGDRGESGKRGVVGEKGPTGHPGVPGLPGPIGIPGPPGAPGITGPRGAPGEIGMMGSTGPPGQRGEDGEDGKKGISGNPGPQGMRGEAGERGIPGELGPKGYMGEPGEMGPEGEQGTPGYQGEDGPSGIQGDPGAPGEKGLDGKEGKKGPNGEKGPRGDRGPAGPPGIPGRVGIPGLSGPPGPESGQDGRIGKKGKPGLPGLDGEPGNTGAMGDPGAQGPRGQIGYPGLEGPQGKVGPPGLAGLEGEKGEIGKSGSAGVPGVKGTTGEKGVRGLKGIRGDRGPPGLMGEEGNQGPLGSKGFTGPPGNPGHPGFQGKKGFQGPVGETGPKGVEGQKGIQGIPGDPGDNGIEGDPGSQGERGAPGLRGETGGTGANGHAGPQGPPGNPGDRGPMGQGGKKGESGATGVSGDPGEVGLRGLNGETGPPGRRGKTGAQGSPGRDGPRGPWGSRGDTGPPGPTGKPGNPGYMGLPGPRGEDGKPGPQGPAGENGVVGISGPKGADGPEGPRGAKGEIGDSGSPGEKGVPGFAGVKGPQGNTGHRGDEGPVGILGPRGERGSDGDSGEPGPVGLTGRKGVSGPAGFMGMRGDIGLKGRRGEQGLPGRPGPPGPDIYITSGSQSRSDLPEPEKVTEVNDQPEVVTPLVPEEDLDHHEEHNYDYGLDISSFGEELQSGLQSSFDALRSHYHANGMNKDQPATTCHDVKMVFSKLNSQENGNRILENGVYWLDPNEGCDKDAFQARCLFESKTRTCIPSETFSKGGISNRSESVPNMDRYFREILASEQLHQLDGDGSNLPVKHLPTSQVRFLHIRSMEAEQIILIQCRDLDIWSKLSTQQTSERYQLEDISFISWNGKRLHLRQLSPDEQSTRHEKTLSVKIITDNCGVRDGSWQGALLRLSSRVPAQLPVTKIVWPKDLDSGSAYIDIGQVCFT